LVRWHHDDVYNDRTYRFERDLAGDWKLYYGDADGSNMQEADIGEVNDLAYTSFGYVFVHIMRNESCFDYIQVEAAPLPAELDVDPDTLNLRSRGRPITAYIELPEGYDVADIHVDSIVLYFEGAPEEGIAIDPRYRVRIGDEDRDGIADLMVKFDRQVVQSYLEPGNVEIYVFGELLDGTLFEGSDVVRVINPGRGRSGHPLFRRR